ncbi:MAG: ribosome maturation factor RimM [bacterium]
MAGKSLVHIGKIINTHGTRGEVKVYPLTDFPERYRSLKEVFLTTTAPESESLVIDKVRFQKGLIILKLRGYNTIDEAERLKGCAIGIPEDQVWPLGEDEYYYFQIIGLKVYTEAGLFLGTVESIFPTGSNDVYVVKKDRKEYLIPATKEVIREINLEAKRIIIHPREGLLDFFDAR